MTLIVDLLSWSFLLAGGFFTVVGAFGLLRMPDIFTRLHASGVLDPFGVSLILMGLMFQAGFTLVTVKLGFLILLLLFTSPVSCHALARAAGQHSTPPQRTGGDAPSKP